MEASSPSPTAAPRAPPHKPDVCIPIKSLGDTHRPRPAGDRHARFLRCPAGSIKLDVIDIDVANRVPPEQDGLPCSQCTQAGLTNDALVTRTNASRTEDPRSAPVYIARILARHPETGMTITLSVRTKVHIVIAFPPRTMWIDTQQRVAKLQQAMIQQLARAMAGRGREFKLPPLPKHRHGRPWTPMEEAEKRKRHEQRMNAKPKEEVEKMSMQFLVEYHKMGFGFHPDMSKPKGTFDLLEFPFLFVFFDDRCARDLAATTLYHAGQDRTSDIYGWRQAEVDATPSLQFMEATGIRPSMPMVVDLDSMLFSDRCHFTTDMEATMEFNPLLYRDRFQRDHTTREITRTPTGRKPPIRAGPDEFARIPRKRLCVFDLECVTTKRGGFPSACRPEDQVICIAALIRDSVDEEDHGYVFVLPGVAHEATALEKEHALAFEIVHCVDERDMYARFRDLLVIDYDVDLVSGWNTAGFDLPYLGVRHALLKMTDGSSRGTYLSREIRKHCEFRKHTTSSSAHGTRTNVVPDTPLVTYFDMMVLIMKRFKYEQYSLRHVSKELLNNTKIDMAAPEMFEHWLSGDPARRRMVAEYCYKDALLPMRIWERLMLDAQTTALARVCTVLYREVLQRGELWKAYSLMFVFAHKQGYILTEDPAYVKMPTWNLKKEAEKQHQLYLKEVASAKKMAESALALTRRRLKQKKSEVGYSAQARADDEKCRVEQTYTLDRLRLKEKLGKKGETEADAKEREERHVKRRQWRQERAAWGTYQETKGLSSDDDDDDDGDDSDESEEAYGDEEDGKRYTGAKVLDPVKGLYDRVSTCDFASLYPSIIKEVNICTSTMSNEKQYLECKELGWEFRLVDIGDGETAYIVQTKQGFLPMIVDTLLIERKKAKWKMADAYATAKKFSAAAKAIRADGGAEEEAKRLDDLAKDQEEVGGVYNGAQLALKVVCNSQYGAIGAPRSSGKYTCVTGARAVTGRGRELLEETKAWVEGKNPMLKVVYGTSAVFFFSSSSFLCSCVCFSHNSFSIR